MKVAIFQTAGIFPALFGMGLSHGVTSGIDIEVEHEASEEKMQKLLKVANWLAPLGQGHNKFLESVDVWLDVTAPRYWWQEADTYRLTTKQSESTMHTIMRGHLEQSDFDQPIWGPTLDRINDLISVYQKACEDGFKAEAEQVFIQLKTELPEGFLQRRVWKVSYKTLRDVWVQRRHHRLPQWRTLFDKLAAELPLWNEWVTSQKDEHEDR